MPERRLCSDIAKYDKNVVYEQQGETAQQHGTGRNHFVPWLGSSRGSKQVRHQ